MAEEARLLVFRVAGGRKKEESSQNDHFDTLSPTPPANSQETQLSRPSVTSRGVDNPGFLLSAGSTRARTPVQGTVFCRFWPKVTKQRFCSIYALLRTFGRFLSPLPAS